MSKYGAAGKMLIIIMGLIFYDLNNSFALTKCEVNDSLNRFSVGFTISPRYTNAIMQNIHSDAILKNLYGYTFVNYNFNFYYSLRKSNLFFNAGLSLIKYGQKQNNVKAYAGTALIYPNIHAVSVYDSVSIKVILYYGGLSLGIGESICRNNWSFTPEVGLINNIYNHYKEQAIDSKYEYLSGGYSIPIADYFLTAYVKCGINLKMGYVTLVMAPIYNTSFYNIYYSSSPGYIRIYQFGLDMGLIYKL